MAIGFAGPLALNAFAHLSRNTGTEDLATMALVGVASAAYMFRSTLWDKPDPYHYKWFERPQEMMGATSCAQKTRDIAEKLDETVNILLSVNESALRLTFR